MNIFVLDVNHEQCAMDHHDKHVVKMCLETAQLLVTAIRVTRGVKEKIIDRKGKLVEYPYVLLELEERNSVANTYFATHVNHPCSLWVRESMSNFYWTLDHLSALNEEWKYRHGHTRNHASFDVVENLLSLQLHPKIDQIKRTPFVQCMPEQYKTNDAIVAYRNYYIAEKGANATYTKREFPNWMQK